MRTRCPSCGKDVPDDGIGKLRCRSCGLRFEPASSRRSRRDEDDDRPRRRSRRDEDSDDRPRHRRRKNSNAKVWIVLGVAAAALVVLVVFVTTVANRVKNALAARDDPQQNAANAPGNPAGVPEPVKPITQLPKGPAANWKAKPDPGPKLAKSPAKSPHSIPLLGDGHLVVPRTPSPFVGIKRTEVRKESFHVLDLLSGQEVTIPGPLPIHDEVLSPDGQYLAGRSNKERDSVEVWSVPERRKLGVMKPPTPHIHMIDIAFGGHLLISCRNGEKGDLSTWRLPDGHNTARLNTEAPRDRVALSHGGKYLATHGRDWIEIRAIADNKLAGRLDFPNRERGQVWGLAFSPDGEEIACLSDVRDSTEILSWKMADGSLAKQHHMDVQLSGKVGNTGVKTPLAWRPDRSGWLCFGEIVVDYASGVAVYSFPRGQRGRDFPGAQLVGQDHIASMEGEHGKRTLEIRPLPTAEIERVAREARSGTKPAPLLVKAGDVSAATRLDRPEGAVSWRVSATAALPAPALATQDIPLTARAEDTLAVLFARPDRARAAVISSFSGVPVTKHKQLRVDMVDLAAGKVQDSFVLTGSGAEQGARPEAFQADISPEGNRIMVHLPSDRNRLDIWDVKGKKHLVGLLPLSSQEGRLTGFDFVDDNRVLTLSDAGRLVLWKVPECKAVYTVHGYSGLLDFNSSRSLVLAFANKSVEILDPATGTRLGQLQAPGAEELIGGAFRADGKAVAVAYRCHLPKVPLGIFNLADGSQTTFIDSPTPFQHRLTWVNADQLLRDLTLIDLNVTGDLVVYDVPGRHVIGRGGPDGRLWFATDAANGGAAVLRSVTVPEPEAKALLADLASGKVQQLTARGTPFQVNVSSNLEKIRSTVQAELPRTLQRYGFQIGPGGVTINIDAQEKISGQMIDYVLSKDNFPLFLTDRPPSGPRFKIAEKGVVAKITLVDAKGMQFYEAVLNYGHLAALKLQPGDYQAQLDAEMYSRVPRQLTYVHFPTTICRIAGRIEHLPRHVVLRR